jgi:outer membrane protein, multidrug efflux system
MRAPPRKFLPPRLSSAGAHVRAAGPVALAAAALAALGLSACKVGPEFTPPREPVPEGFSGVHQNPPAPEPRTASDRGPTSFWWHEFHDPELDKLVEEATAGNLDLKAAYFRIAEARLQVVAARAQGLPSLNASGSYTREQLGIAGLLKSRGIEPGTGPAASPQAQDFISSLEKPINLWQIGFDASWEIDLFGKVRRSVESAKAQSEVAVESRNDLLVSLEAEVAQTYLQLRANQALRGIALELIDVQRQITELTANRHAHGLAGQADVESARGQLATLEAELPPYDQSIAASRHALAVLTGRPPEALDAEFGETGELPELPPEIPVGVPSALARRRPDIRNAEAGLHAATAEIGVSMASLFPDVSLAGTYGLRNLGARYLLDWQSHFYTFGPSVSLPIFHGGALVANVRLSKAQAAEAALDYRKTVLNALQEVEDGLSAVHEDSLRTGSLRETVAADGRSLAIELDAYRHGVISYVSALTVQLQEREARQQLAQGMLTQSTDLVKLYKALGGGWENAAGESGANGD